MARLSPPRLRTKDTDQHRSASWLELFYDLVFVVAVAALGHRLLVDHSVGGTWAFIGLFVPLWWTWASYTFYADRYDTDDLGQRLLAVAQMVAIALMAASISGDESDSVTAFAAAYVFARLVLLTMYWRAHRHVPETRELVDGYLKGFSAGAVFWIVSIWVPEPARYVLWAVGISVDLAAVYRVRKIQAKVPLDSSHLPERFGLFTILVLGESIAAVVAGLSEFHWETAATLRAVFGVLVASGLWWLYFDNLHGGVVRRRKEQRTAWRPTVWIYSHLPLAVALTASGIGLEFLVTEETSAGRWIVAGGVAAALLAMAVISIATERGDDDRDRKQAIIRAGAAGAVLLIGLISGSWSALALLIVFGAICAVQIALDLWLVHDDEAALA